MHSGQQRRHDGQCSDGGSPQRRHVLLMVSSYIHWTYNTTMNGPARRATPDIHDVHSPDMGEDTTNKVRGVRLEQDLWDRLGPAGQANGLDRSGIIRQLVRWYLRVPGAKLPQRPER